MQQFEWLSEKGGNFFNLLQKEGGSLKKKGGGGGVPTLEETMTVHKESKLQEIIFIINYYLEILE